MSSPGQTGGIWKGSLFIILAACCYGMLGTFVKMAYRDGYGTAEVTVCQFVIGFIALLALNGFSKHSAGSSAKAPIARSGKSHLKLVAAGSSLGLTSIFYYMSVRLIPVSLAIVLLIQAVWISLVVEMVQKRRRPEMSKIVAVLVIIFGTSLATDVWCKNQ